MRCRPNNLGLTCKVKRAIVDFFAIKSYRIGPYPYTIASSFRTKSPPVTINVNILVNFPHETVIRVKIYVPDFIHFREVHKRRRLTAWHKISHRESSINTHSPSRIYISVTGYAFQHFSWYMSCQQALSLQRR